MEYCELNPTVYSTAEYRAQKQYRCCECRLPILIGEKYLYCFGVWDGEASTYRQHIVCAEACEFFRDYINDGDCLQFGSLLEEAREYWRTFDIARKRDNNIALWRGMLAKIRSRQRQAHQATGRELEHVNDSKQT